MLVQVPHGDIQGVWHEFHSLIASAFDAVPLSDDTIIEIYDDLLAHRSILWVNYDGHDLLMAGTTKIMNYPNGRRVCVITSVAGHSHKKWVHTIQEIEQYAKSQGCVSVRLSGRQGWKILKSQGYHEPWVTLEKEI